MHKIQGDLINFVKSRIALLLTKHKFNFIFLV
jgi:hypothetical protein